MSMVRRTLWIAAILIATAYVALIVLVDRGRKTSASPSSVIESAPAPPTRAPLVLLQNEHEVLTDAATKAWHFVDRNFHESTGLVSPLDAYPVTTMWDMGSAIAAQFAAHQLGLISDSLYRARIRRTLRGISALPLFAGVAFNKRYYSTSSGMAGAADQPAPEGYGWSAIDIGRLLLWLDIVRRADDSLAADAEAAARHVDLSGMIENGELIGAQRRGRGIWRYQEGRIGYEQYAARGFERWGANVTGALDPLRHAQVVELGADKLLGDRRGHDCLTSEPFVLSGLEVGWSTDEGKIAQSLLHVQQTRYEQSGALTAVSEDALFAAPHHFYYYCALASGTSFVVLSPNYAVLPNGPRTVSTKAAFGWYALLPNAYTVKLVTTIREAAAASNSWPSAFAEASLAPAGAENINTAAVILEAAAYIARGRRPLDWPMR